MATLSALVTTLFVPPANLAPFAACALMLGRRIGRRVAAAALMLLVLLSLPIVANTLLRSLGDGGSVAAGQDAPQAIVVLGADVAEGAAGQGAGVPGALTLQRLRTGAALARKTGLPILVTGGIVSTDVPPVAKIMADSLADDFRLPAKWVEPDSATTWENARDSVPILRAAGISRAFVVTHAWHMRRAMIAFAGSGVQAVPFPLDQAERSDIDAWSFAPRTSALMTSYYALHEWIGCAWYAARSAPAGG